MNFQNGAKVDAEMGIGFVKWGQGADDKVETQPENGSARFLVDLAIANE